MIIYTIPGTSPKAELLITKLPDAASYIALLTPPNEITIAEVNKDNPINKIPINLFTKVSPLLYQ